MIRIITIIISAVQGNINRKYMFSRLTSGWLIELNQECQTYGLWAKNWP